MTTTRIPVKKMRVTRQAPPEPQPVERVEVRELPARRIAKVEALIENRGVRFAETYARAIFPINSGAVLRYDAKR